MLSPMYSMSLVKKTLVYSSVRGRIQQSCLINWRTDRVKQPHLIRFLRLLFRSEWMFGSLDMGRDSLSFGDTSDILLYYREFSLQESTLPLVKWLEFLRVMVGVATYGTG